MEVGVRYLHGRSPPPPPPVGCCQQIHTVCPDNEPLPSQDCISEVGEETPSGTQLGLVSMLLSLTSSVQEQQTTHSLAVFMCTVSTRRNTLVFTDLSESELLSFDGNGYLYTQQLAGGVNTKIRSESIGVDSELVFSFSAQSRDGLIVFMFEPSEQVSIQDV